jgi:Transmembrane secretion effector
MERASGIARHAHEPTESAVPGKPAAPSTDHTRPGAVPPGTLAALAVPNFRRYVSGQALSLIGTWVETVAQALLVLKLTHSGTILGLTTAARYAPILLLSPYAGLLVDRYSNRGPGSSRSRWRRSWHGPASRRRHSGTIAHRWPRPASPG